MMSAIEELLNALDVCPNSTCCHIASLADRVAAARAELKRRETEKPVVESEVKPIPLDFGEPWNFGNLETGALFDRHGLCRLRPPTENANGYCSLSFAQLRVLKDRFNALRGVNNPKAIPGLIEAVRHMAGRGDLLVSREWSASKIRALDKAPDNE